MSRSRNLAVFLSATAGVLVGATLVLAQSSFPVRFDDPPPETAAPPVGALSADAIRLVPRDFEPFSCTAATVGYLYVKNDVGDVNGAHDSLLCQCKPDEDAMTYSWQNAGKIGGACA